MAAYILTGLVTGGVLGYTAGVGGGLLYSNGDFGYAHQSGVFHGQIGAAIGSVVGTIAGSIANYSPADPPPPPIDLPGPEGELYASNLSST